MQRERAIALIMQVLVRWGLAVIARRVAIEIVDALVRNGALEVEG